VNQTDQIFNRLNEGVVLTLEQIMEEFKLSKRSAESCLLRLHKSGRLARSSSPAGRYTALRHAAMLDEPNAFPLPAWTPEEEPPAKKVTVDEVLAMLEEFAVAEARRGNVGVSNILRKVINRVREP